MKIYPESYSVEVEVGFTDLNGTAVTPTEIRAKLYDERDQVVEDFGSIAFAGGDTKVTIVVPAIYNDLGTGQLSAARILRVEMDTSAGTIRRAFSYIIEGEFRLELMTNTFMSIEAAEIMARGFVNISGWNVADDDKRYAAMIEAFNRLTRLPMRYTTEVAGAEYAVGDEIVIPREDWSSLTVNEFNDFPEHFRNALRRAQLAEANELLQGDKIGRKLRQGIISETIGESSMSLNEKRLDYGVSSDTLKHLTGYIHFNMRIARA